MPRSLSPTRSTRDGGVVVAVVLAGLVLAGCTGTADPAPSRSVVETTSADDGASSVVSPSPTEAARAPGNVVGPVTSLLGLSGEHETVADVVASIRNKENAIAVCMVAQGFEYYPNIPTPEQVTVPEGPLRGSREFAERYGYGVWIPARGEGGGYIIDGRADEAALAYESSMSEAMREAYDTALWGDVVRADGDATYREGGCHDRQARAAGDGADGDYLMTVWDEAMIFLGSMHLDPAFDALDAEWSECMAGEGYRYDSPRLAEESFVEGQDENFAQAEADGVSWRETPLARERAELELAVAVADLDCRAVTSYVERYDEIHLELEDEYVAAHRADLDLLAEALATD